jgi:DNA end-binding protein Ku
MRVLWKGAITFGLVTIPVSLYPATQREELKFRLLRESDHSPVNYKRVAEADGKEVPWDKIVKGYEYEKGKFVILKEEDFKRVDVEATQTVDIINFVKIDDVDPLLFYKPYYLEVGKGGDKAYVLLRDALIETGKIAIAKVVIRARQHLAAVKPQKDGLMLELMHFPQELIDVSEFKEPAEKKIGKAEMQMAKQLIESMTSDWKSDEYHDEYRDALEKMIHEKIEHGDKAAPKAAKKRKPTNVIDLVSVLQESLQQTGKSSKGGKKTTAKKKAPKTAASKTAHKKAA